MHRVEWEQSIDHQHYIENCLQSVTEETKRQRPRSGAHAIKFHHDIG